MMWSLSNLNTLLNTFCFHLITYLNRRLQCEGQAELLEDKTIFDSSLTSIVLFVLFLIC